MVFDGLFFPIIFNSGGLVLRTSRIIEKKARIINPRENEPPKTEKEEKKKRLGLKDRVNEIKLNQNELKAFQEWNEQRNAYLHGNIKKVDKKAFYKNFVIVNSGFNTRILSNNTLLNTVKLFLDNNIGLLMNSGSPSGYLVIKTAKIIESKAKLLNPKKKDEDGKPLTLGLRMQGIGLTPLGERTFLDWSKQRNQYVHGVKDWIDRKRFLKDYRVLNKELDWRLICADGKFLNRIKFHLLCFLNAILYYFSDLRFAVKEIITSIFRTVTIGTFGFVLLVLYLSVPALISIYILWFIFSFLTGVE